ncbi:MAG TPA: sugar ABC transporter permease, partial [Ktedonobacteraceae bacterium]
MVSTAVESTGVPSRGRPSHWRERLSPWLWVAPSLLFLIVFLIYPLINTVVLSFMNSDSTSFVGFKNYGIIFTSPGFIEILENNLLWLVLGTAGTVALGLVIAVLVDRVRIESLAKSTIFIPMALSFVAASVIWRFVYDYAAPGQPQIGLLNAFLGLFGAPPQAWLINSPLNNFALIIVYV